MTTEEKQRADSLILGRYCGNFSSQVRPLKELSSFKKRRIQRMNHCSFPGETIDRFKRKLP
jgi:hypothetical protein